MIKITPEEFNLFSKYIFDVSGIAIDKTKEYLIEARLGALVAKFGCSSFSGLYVKIKDDTTGAIERDIVDAISTNETYFFRDATPFELLQYKIIPDVIDKKRRNSSGTEPIPIRIWSAACSNGQEIYSIAMVIKELGLSPEKFDVHLLGTDISDTAIAKASYGVYNKFEVTRGLNEARINKYFDRVSDQWRIKDELRAVIAFRKFNLMDSFISIGRFDIVLCRNVAIYFSQSARKKLYDKIAEVIGKDGYLIIGATESLLNDTTIFQPQKYHRSIFYQLK